VAGEPDVRFVVDLGANVGYATHYLLSAHPQARAVVVEPDAGNMAVCRRTLAGFGKRVTFIQAGVWSRSGPLVVGRTDFRDNADWSRQVRPAAPGEEPDCHALTVADVLDAAGFPRADILKMDIEGAEVEAFREAGWLARVRTLVVELHGPECEAALARGVSEFQYTPDACGELTVLRGLTRLTPGQ
jgi:FkbM family methyltransferase